MAVQQFQYHPVVGFHYIPGLRTRVEHEGGGYLVRVNQAGFRCEHEFEARRRPGRGRVLLFGDSFTAGDGVSNELRFGDLLEKLLPDVEVYNFGLPGSGTDQQYLAYTELAAHYERDLVILAVQVENIRRVVARQRLVIASEGDNFLLAKPYFELQPDGTLALKNVPVPPAPMAPEDLPADQREFVDQGGRLFWLRQVIGGLGGRVKALAQSVTRYQPLPEYDDPQGPAWTLMKAILRRFVRELGGPVVVVPIPLYQYVEETASADGFRARFAELREWPGVTVHDPLPDYYAVPLEARRGFRFPGDLHPTPAHHRLLAESLAGVVRRVLPGVAAAAR